MKAHIGTDAGSGPGLLHTVRTPAANEADAAEVGELLHGKEDEVWADSGRAQSRVNRGVQ